MESNVLPRKFCKCHRDAVTACHECAARGYTTPNPEDRIEQMFEYADVLRDIEQLEVDAAVADDQDDRDA